MSGRKNLSAESRARNGGLPHPMDRKKDKLIRRSTMGATCVAAYLLLTADYGPNQNALDPIKRAIQSAEFSAKQFIFGSSEGVQENEKEIGTQENEKERPKHNNAK